MRKLFISGIALLSVLCVTGAQAADGMTGSVKAKAKIIDVSGNEAKFSEYGDPDSGVTGGIEMNYDAGEGFLKFKADDVARDTQNFKIEAGQHGKFKLNAYYNEIQHNFTFDARTFYSGVGSNRLTTTATSTSLPKDSATWGSVFDYSLSRNQYGAGIKLNMLKPFYADFSVSQEDRTGIKATGTYSSVSFELPEPIDYKTNNFQAEVGYGKDPVFVSLAYTLNSFDNANSYLFFSSLASTARDEFLTLPPNNTFSKLALKGRVKLPMHSNLALSYGKSDAESEVNLPTAYQTAGSAKLNNLSDSIFNGKVESTSYNVVLTSSPVDMLDAKVFYSSYEKDNKSDSISSSSTTGTTTAASFANHLFGYEKKSYGLEAGLNLPGHVKLTPYYKHVDVERHREDIPETTDKIYGINAKWSNEMLAVKAGYEIMDRKGEWEQIIMNAVGNQTTANALEPYVRRFDAATQDKKTFKIGVDVSPNDHMNIGLTFKNKKSDYTETKLGLLKEDSNGVNLSADYTLNDKFSVSGYVDYEVGTLDQTQRRVAGTLTPALGNPAGDSINGDSNYTWTANQKNKSLDYGLAINMTLIPKTLSLRAQYDHVRSDGLADFTYYESVPTGYTNDTVDSENWDDYKKNSFMLKATYNASQNITLVGGYAYEKYEYNDQFYDGYSYVWNSSATAYNYLTGANANPNYTANVFFLSAKYKFF